MSTTTDKKTFTILCAYDIPCFATIEVEAGSEEEAAKMIEDDFWGVVHDEQFEPEWNQPDNHRAYLVDDSGVYHHIHPNQRHLKMTFEEYQDLITTKQDALTDLLLELHREEGEAFVKKFLRMAIVNYAAERTGREDGPIFERMISEIANAITTPCHQHHTL